MAVYSIMLSLVVFLYGIERLCPAVPSQKGEWLNNGAAFALSAFGQTVIVPLFAAFETTVVNSAGGGLIDLRSLPWGVGALVYLVAMDFGEYAFHRAQHRVPWMWALHSLHHSDRALSAATTQRHFWIEPGLKSISIWLAVALLFKVDRSILLVYFVAAFYNFFSHSNIRLGFGPFSWVLNSPQYHRLHHSREPEHYNSNFSALLPIFDVLSGSYRRPKSGEFPATGLNEVVCTPLDVIVWPVRNVFRARRTPAPAIQTISTLRRE